MPIYRGAGGSGDAINDSSSEATLVAQLVVEAQADADAAAASATSASGSATSAASSATSAASSASAASTSATNAASSASTATTKASEASTSATNAANSATTASTQATNASNSASAASTSATNAAASASTATTQATNASNSASAAATSATNASNSATTASTAATNSQSSAATSQYYSAYSADRAVESAASATAAAGSATTASTQATNAASSASTATTQAGIATTKAGEAATSATNAASSASSASTSASTATTQATNASNSATSAATAATNAAASYDAFDDRYLGSKSTNPTLDNDGNALLTGALYFNTVSNSMKVYNGSAWLDAYASLSGALIATNNLSDLNNVSTARTNLGLGTIATQAASSVAITGGAIDGTTIGATTASSGKFTSLSDSGNLTFTGTGNRITGDFSGTLNSTLFQTSTANSFTAVSAVPNGTNFNGGFRAYNNADPTNAAWLGISTPAGTAAALVSGITGTGTYLPLIMQTGGSERLRIDTSGNVSIGSSTTSNRFTVVGGTSAFFSSSTAAVTLGSQTGVAAVFKNNASSVGGGYGLAVNVIGTGLSSLQSMSFDSATAYDLALQPAGGNVGIGTSSPVSTLGRSLHVYNSGSAGSVADNSTIKIESVNRNSVLSLQGNATSTQQIQFVDASAVAYASIRAETATTSLGFFTGSAGSSLERMRIDSSGNLLIGTTAITSGWKMVVQGAAYFASSVSSTSGDPNFSAGGSRTFMDWNGSMSRIGSLTGGSTGGPVGFYVSNGEVARFDTSGNLGIGTTSFSEKLTVNGNVRLQTNSKTRIEYLNSTGAYTLGSTGGSAIAFEYISGNHEIAFETHWSGNSHAEQMRLTKEGNLKFNSGYGSAATAYGCRAWVNFNGTGTVAIRASGNVSSITDNGTGDYTVNFTTAMPDANYSFTALARNDSTSNSTIAVSALSTSTKTASACQVLAKYSNSGGTGSFDSPEVNVSIFR